MLNFKLVHLMSLNYLTSLKSTVDQTGICKQKMLIIVKLGLQLL